MLIAFFGAEEVSASYFMVFGDCEYATINPEDHEIQSKIRIEELGKAIQGACLLYARCFRDDFNINDEAKLVLINDDITQLLISLFTSAFPLTQSECIELMSRQDLLPQLVREMVYWTASSAEFVTDLRNAHINLKAYPQLPENMQGCKLAENQRQFLKDSGFIQSKRNGKTGNTQQLGSASGRLPLIALNALTVKLISHGILREYEAGLTQSKAMHAKRGYYLLGYC